MKALEETEAELEKEVRQREKEKTSLQSLADQLSEQIQSTEQKCDLHSVREREGIVSARLNYACEEDRVFACPLLQASEEKAMRESHELVSQFTVFASVLREFSELTEKHGVEMYFTQCSAHEYWKKSEDLTNKLEW